jgi:hypothetical protein
MLVDLSEQDIASGRNIAADEDSEGILFTDTFERVSEGIYKVDFFFGVLNDDLFNKDNFFDNWGREFWQTVAKPGYETETPEAETLRAAYFARLEDTTLPTSSYGVCDSPEQILERFPRLATIPERLLITINEVRKEHQPDHDGWRWHKWGEYIGNKEIMHEYLADEDDSIESVFTYQILVFND